MANENDQELLCPSLGDGGAYGKVRSGKKDPYHGFLVKKLISLEPTFVVYLTEDNDLWWCSTDAKRCATEYMRQIESELTRLASVPINQLGSRHKQYINELSGTGIKGFLGCEDKAEELEKAANEAVESIKEAKEYAIARNREYSRIWYACSSLIVLVTVLVLAGLVALSREGVPALWLIAQYISAGALGAFFSIMVSISGAGGKQLELDASAEKITHIVSASVKMGMGIVGALLVGLGIQAGVLLSFTNTAERTPLSAPLTASPLVLAVCLVAGISERLVNSFIEQVGTMKPNTVRDNPKPK